MDIRRIIYRILNEIGLIVMSVIMLGIGYVILFELVPFLSGKNTIKSSENATIFAVVGLFFVLIGIGVLFSKRRK